MQNFIRNILRQEGVKTVLRSEVIECKLIFTVIEFMDKRNLFKSLTLAYNESNIFVIRNKHLLPVKNTDILTVSSNVRSTVKVYTSKKEMIDNREPIPNKESMEKLFEIYENDISSDLLSVHTENFSVVKVIINWYPTITYIIHINFKHKRYTSLIYNFNRVTVINEFILTPYKEEYKNFIKQIFKGLGDLIWI